MLNFRVSHMVIQRSLPLWKAGTQVFLNGIKGHNRRSTVIVSPSQAGRATRLPFSLCARTVFDFRYREVAL